MEDIIFKYHAGQFRNKGEIPYTEHLFGVATILETALNITGECSDNDLLQDFRNAALGHDLIEDTGITEAEIIAATNEGVLNLIKELSNPVDDNHLDVYMSQLQNDSEDARLIKYCDLIENTNSVYYNLHILGAEWFHDFYRPILSRSTDVLAATEFTKYPQTAALLRNILEISANLINTKLQIMKRNNAQ